MLKRLVAMTLMVLLSCSCSHTARGPASGGEDCFSMVNFVIGSKNESKLTHLFSRLKSHKSPGTFQEDAYADYSRLLEREGEELVRELPDTPEAVMAMVDFYANTLKRSSNDFSQSKRKNAFKLIEKMKSRKKWDLRDVESVTDDLIALKYSEKYRIGSDRVEDYVKASIHRDLVKKGLIQFFSKYSPEEVPRFTRFMNSHWGEGFKTALFNLPVLLGTPPLYLPSGKGIRLSADLANELFKKGLDEEMMKRIIKDAYGPNAEMLVRFSADYSWVRRRYLAAVTVYLSLAYVYDFYVEQKVITKESEELDDMNKEAEALMSAAQDLADSGIDVFDETQTLSDIGEQRFCQLIESCLKNYLPPDADAQKKKEVLKSCIQFMDPSRKCPAYKNEGF